MSFLINEQFEKQQIMESLFLDACVPQMKKRMERLLCFCCSGCKTDQPNQLAHECLGYGVLDTNYSRYNMAAPYMSNKTRQIYTQMELLIKTEEIYKDVTLADFLAFYTETYHTDPFNRLCSDSTWKNIMLRKITGCNPSSAVSSPSTSLNFSSQHKRFREDDDDESQEDSLPRP